MALTEETFQSTLAAAQSGAEWAWATLYSELAGPVTGYLASRGASEPEDTTSEVFLQIARNMHGFTGELSSFRSWVFVIAHRRLIDDRRARIRRPELTELQPEAMVGGRDAEDEAIDRLVTSELRRAFDQLTPQQRDVLSLRIIAGLTLAETAEVLGKKVGAVKTMQHRALGSLQQKIDLKGVTL
jgi:RNA polymerase sigma-70 factor, ECF subfamily